MAPFQFEGGNVVVGEEFVFVGRDTVGGDKDGDLLRALGILGERRRICLMGARVELPRSEVRLRQQPEGAVVELVHGFAGRHQPIFHIDAFVSIAGRGPNGRERVLVGDTGLASTRLRMGASGGGCEVRGEPASVPVGFTRTVQRAHPAPQPRRRCAEQRANEVALDGCARAES